jgi:hypothetical protein
MQARWSRLIAVLLFAVGIASGADMARAEDAPPDAFYGKFEGSGAARDPNSIALGLMDRDMDVEIGPEGEGFFVAWTTVFRDIFSDDEPRRNSARVAFVPSGRPGLYLATDAAAGIAAGLSWASITGNRLSVRLLAIEDDGSYVVQTYHRSLSEAGLFLFFISDVDGQTIRMVNAHLKKAE